MLNINNTVNYEINVKQKYSWSTVFAWLYLKTIGRILPKKWNKWAENILSNKVTFQDTTMQTEYVETTDKNIGADLKPEVAEKGSQSEIISKDGEVQTEENSEFTDESCFDTIVNDEFIDEDYNSMEEVSIEEEGVSQELELERLQNAFLKKENEDLESKLAECKEELVGVKEKDGKINSLMRLNEGLDEDLKSNVDKLTAQSAEVENLKKQLQSTQEFKQQLEKEKIDLEGKSKDLNSQLSTVVSEKKDLENEIARLQEQVQILEGSKEWELAGIDDSLKKVFLDVIGMLEKELLINNQEQQLQGKKVYLEDKLKILISQLNATEEEKQILEGNKAEEIERLKAELKKESDEVLQEKFAEQEKLIKQLQKEQQQAEKADIKKLQEEKENMEEQLKIMQQQLLNNQEQQKLEEKLKDVDKRLEEIDGETQKSQGQTKTKASDTVSLVSTASTAKSTTSSSKSTLSKLRNLPNKLFGDKNLNNFLSRKNEELKKSFSEFEKKHFCHNVLNETIKSLSNQDDGKFESSELLELLESNLKQSAREIIEAKVKEVVNKHCNIGKNVGKELRDGTLKAKLSPSVRKCIKKLEFNKQEEGVNKIVDSILHSFNSKKNNNNDSGELLKEIVVEELVEAKMRFFSDKIQELQLVSSIRDKFLSPDQKMCSRIPGKENMYKLSTEVINKIRGPNSSMSHTNTVSVHSLNAQRVA